MGETIEALVDAGKASAGPPLGPSLGPTGVNVKQVVDEINSKTKEMAGMQVPVKIKIDDVTTKRQRIVQKLDDTDEAKTKHQCVI